MAKTRVVVVDDSALIRSLLKEIINRQSDMQCVGVAADPFVAREMIRATNPDVITLDVEMPRMDGIEFLGKLMRLRPMPVVMVSTLTERGAEVTLRALELGAVDFVAKPKIGVADGMRQLTDDITDKIRTAARAQIRRVVAPPAGEVAQPALPPSAVGRLSTEKLIFIGASTGGTEAIKDVLIGLPADCAGGADHAAHAARLHHQLRQAPGPAVPHPRGRGRRRRACAAWACLPGAGRLASGDRALGRQLHRPRS